MLMSALLRDASLRFAAEDRPAEASPPEVHPAEVRVAEVRTEEVGLGTPRVPGGYPLLKLSDVIVVRHRIMQGRGAEAQRDDDSPFCGPTPSSLTASGTPPPPRDAPQRLRNRAVDGPCARAYRTCVGHRRYSWHALLKATTKLLVSWDVLVGAPGLEPGTR